MPRAGAERRLFLRRETEPMDLVTERDVEEAWKRGIPVIRCLPRCIVTDAARERAMSLEIEIKR